MFPPHTCVLNRSLTVSLTDRPAKSNWYDIPLALWSWGAVLATAAAGFCVQLPLFILTVPFDPRRNLVGRCYRLTAVVSSFLIPYWHFRVHGPIPAAPRRTVVVGNHASQADPFLISWLPWEMKWLAKDAIFKIPFIGCSMYLSGDIKLRRGQKDSAQRAMVKCAEWLDRGANVMIFPEGTRSKDEILLPFKDGAFRLAIEKQADVLPIAVVGTRDALPKHSWRPGTSYARVTVGKPISTVGMTLDDVQRLKDMTRAEIESLVTQLRPVVQALSSAG
jgi:1-acyl-sn-glycerol-3-phosphate acyltransferase